MAGVRLPPDQWWPAQDPVCSARRVALATGITLRVVEAGPRDGPPVLLLHGWGVHAYLWQPNMAALAQAGHRVIAPDLPGHGLSDIPVGESHYTLDAMLRHLAALLDALGLARVPVVAQSMGGMLAMQLAARHPERVTRLALFGPVGFGVVPWVAGLARLLPDLPGSLLAAVAPRWMSSAVLWRVWGRPKAWTERDVDEYWALTQRPDLPRALLWLLRRLPWAPHDPAWLARVGQPVLVVFGTADRTVVPGRVAARLVAALPQGRLELVPDAGHVVNAERAAWSNARLHEFLGAGD